MIRFFLKKNEEKKISLDKKFQWVKSLEKVKLEQKKEAFSLRLKHFSELNGFIETEEWQDLAT